MLVLTRNIDESIFIGDQGDIKVKILGIFGRQVRLGIEAPDDVEVHRKEVYKKIYASLTTNHNG